MARKIAEKIVRFLTIELWQLDKEDLPRPHAAMLTPLRVAAMTIKGYMHDGIGISLDSHTISQYHFNQGRHAVGQIIQVVGEMSGST